MKKSLLLTAISLLGLSAMYAQDVSKREAYNPFSRETQVSSVVMQQASETIKRCQTTQEYNKLHIQKDFNPLAIEKLKKTRSASDVLSGVFIMSGKSDFNGTTHWTMQIEQDAQNTAKYWISNLVPDATTEKIYGILNGATLTFPVGQTIIKTDDITAICSGINENGEIITSGNIIAQIDESKHTITFVEGFGSQITRYSSNPTNVGKWFDIILPGVYGIAEPFFIPLTSYQEPEGALNYGLSRNYRSLEASVSIASPNTTWTWTNTSVSLEGTEWEWEYTDTDNQKITSTEGNLSIDAKIGNYGVPSLTGTYKGNDSTYIWGASFNNHGNDRIISAGGSSIDGTGGTMFDLTNANLDYSFISWQFAKNVYPFGTGINNNGWATNALISVYDKPQTPLTFKGVDIYLGAFSAPATTEFNLYVVKLEFDEEGFPILGDTIATGTTTAASILSDRAGYYCLPFETFVAIDEDGFESELPYIETNDQFALIFTGYNKENVDLSVFSEYFDRPGNKTYSYFTYIDPKTGKEVVSSWIDLPNPMYMQLHDAAYSYISPSVNEINADVNGGTYDLSLVPLYNGLVLDEETCPDWISITQNDHFDQSNWGSDLQITVKALPKDVKGRSANLKYYTDGASCTITVNQGITTGISSTEESIINVSVSNESFDITYPAGINNVTILNVSGLVLANYNLPTNGKHSISTVSLNKGMYLLKFDNNQIIKVIK